jgi:hypothetical protein
MAPGRPHRTRRTGFLPPRYSLEGRPNFADNVKGEKTISFLSSKTLSTVTANLISALKRGAGLQWSQERLMEEVMRWAHRPNAMYVLIF